MTNEQLHKNAIAAVKEALTKYSGEHTINGILWACSGEPLNEEDHDFYGLQFVDVSNPWLLHVRVKYNVGLDLICEPVGYNFFRIKDIWLKDQVSYSPARVELLLTVSDHTTEGLAYLLPPDERSVWVISDGSIREKFNADLLAFKSEQ